MASGSSDGLGILNTPGITAHAVGGFLSDVVVPQSYAERLHWAALDVASMIETAPKGATIVVEKKADAHVRSERILTVTITTDV